MNYIVAFKQGDVIRWTFLKDIDKEEDVVKTMSLIGIDNLMYQNTLLDMEDCLDKAYYLMRMFKQDVMNESTKIDFGEALRSMELGFKVEDQFGRIYVREGDQIFCYPEPKTKPKHRLPRIKFRLDEVLSKDYQVIY